MCDATLMGVSQCIKEGQGNALCEIVPSSKCHPRQFPFLYQVVPHERKYKVELAIGVLTRVEKLQYVLVGEASQGINLAQECLVLNLRQVKITIQTLHGDEIIGLKVPAFINRGHPTGLQYPLDVVPFPDDGDWEFGHC